ncbi:hypothetical protein TNIN_417291 [Trichonephila inaurata madagascariensis]|uniref:Uncharacterized protein n=1 Tax=Trichonephila inaurata madagascariensis TaxID=2747483 RepID=A0A8X6XCZ3_9ARAC|nr:hypothetical protein TNIN_417291 [Trichonephila inaurata madagascariensis]
MYLIFLSPHRLPGKMAYLVQRKRQEQLLIPRYSAPNPSHRKGCRFSHAAEDLDSNGRWGGMVIKACERTIFSPLLKRTCCPSCRTK